MAALLSLLSVHGQAHDEVTTYFPEWPADSTLGHAWGAPSVDPPQAVKDQIVTARTRSNNFKNSRAATVVFDADADGRVLYTTDSSGNCGANSIACSDWGPNASNPTPSTAAWRVWIKPHNTILGNNNRLHWCVLNSTDCHYVVRTALHEFGHMIGLDHYPFQGSAMKTEERSIMYFAIPFKGEPGDDTNEYQPCDWAGLQWGYGRDDNSDGFSPCLDHVAGVSSDNKLRTVLTREATDQFVCTDFIEPRCTIFRGLLKTIVHSGYGALSDDKLANRSVVLK